MKKIVALLLLLALSLTFAGCKKGDDPDTVRLRIEKSVTDAVIDNISIAYELDGEPEITFDINEAVENIYSVGGEITVLDTSGCYYSGLYDATVTYEPKNDVYTADCNVGVLFEKEADKL